MVHAAWFERRGSCWLMIGWFIITSGSWFGSWMTEQGWDHTPKLPQLCQHWCANPSVARSAIAAMQLHQDGQSIPQDFQRRRQVCSPDHGISDKDQTNTSRLGGVNCPNKTCWRNWLSIAGHGIQQNVETTNQYGIVPDCTRLLKVQPPKCSSLHTKMAMFHLWETKSSSLYGPLW